MVASTTSAPELTQEQVQRILIQPLQAASVFLASGPRIFDVTAAGPVRIPKFVSMTPPNWHGGQRTHHRGRCRPPAGRSPAPAAGPSTLTHPARRSPSPGRSRRLYVRPQPALTSPGLT